MDKKSIIAMVLISIIILLLPYYQHLINGNDYSEKSRMDNVDTLKIERTVKSNKDTNYIIEEYKKEAINTENINNIFEDVSERIIKIETENAEIVLSNRGGGSFKRYTLKKYSMHDSSLVNIIDNEIQNGIDLSFHTQKGDNSNIGKALFFCDYNKDYIKLKNKEIFSIEYYIMIDGDSIKKSFQFDANSYQTKVSIYFSNAEKTILNGQYQIGWKNGIPSTESYVADDYTYNQAYVYMAKELESFDITEEKKIEKQNISGKADWVALRTKYFLIGFSNPSENINDGIYFNGEGIKKEDYIKKIYNIGFNAKYSNEKNGDTYGLYIGPLDHKELGNFDNNLDILVMNNGWYERTFRFISLIALKIIELLYSFIPNYGIVIIIFSLLIKILLHPLTKKSYSSMKEMQKLQPVIADLNEKYKNDPQRKNKELMKIYKEHGVNPLGGCLPTILQLPFLFALFIVFRSTIQLRGAVFIPGWINDLSRTDTLFLLPINIPWYGNEFNLLPILMTVTMIIQSKMTMQDPKQKALIYIMPVFMLLMFNKFPSGLNLYYTVFNIWSIIQQMFITDRLKK